MQVRPRHVVMALVLFLIVLPVLYAVFEEAPHGVAVGVTIGALALLVCSYAYAGIVVLGTARKARAGLLPEDEEAQKELMRRRFRWHIPIMLGVPLLVMAAHPWGMASVVVAFAALVICQFLFLHVTLAAGFVMQRRARRQA